MIRNQSFKQVGLVQSQGENQKQSNELNESIKSRINRINLDSVRE